MQALQERELQRRQHVAEKEYVERLACQRFERELRAARLKPLLAEIEARRALKSTEDAAFAAMMRQLQVCLALRQGTTQGTRDTAQGTRGTAQGTRDTAQGSRGTAQGTRCTTQGTMGTAQGMRGAAQGTRGTA